MIENGPESHLRTQQGKQEFAAKSSQVYDLMLELRWNQYQRAKGDASFSGVWWWQRWNSEPVDALWNCAQEAKARSLTDMIARYADLTDSEMCSLSEHSRGLIEQERRLQSEIQTSKSKRAINLQLRQLHVQMRKDPSLLPHLQVRTGCSMEVADLVRMQQKANGEVWVAVDWIFVNDEIVMMVKSSNDENIHVEKLTTRKSEVQNCIDEHLTPFEQLKSTLTHIPETVQDEMSSLVEPLARLATPGDLLVFCPTGCLHQIPLHALPINDEETVIDRHPVVYCPSLSLLSYLRTRNSRRGARNREKEFALFGNPTQDLEGAASGIEVVASHLEVPCLVNQYATCAAFKERMTEADCIVFAGHAEHDSNQPMRSHLKFKEDSNLFAHDVLEFRDLNLDLVALIACSSGKNKVEKGDEPIGLVPAFLLAGANSVIATLWVVEASFACSHFMVDFFKAAKSDTAFDKARALRHAVCKLKKHDKYQAPYFWAPFCLYGDWRGALCAPTSERSGR